MLIIETIWGFNYYNEHIKFMKLSQPEFAKIAFNLAMEIVNEHNASKFVFLGYKHLDYKLILIHDDCKAVWIFKNDSSDERGFTIEKYYTKSYKHEGYIENLKQFEIIYNQDVPETDVEWLEIMQTCRRKIAFEKIQHRFNVDLQGVKELKIQDYVNPKLTPEVVTKLNELIVHFENEAQQ